VYYGSERQLEYDFEIRSVGWILQRIAIEFQGLETLQSELKAIWSSRHPVERFATVAQSRFSVSGNEQVALWTRDLS
jgi:hypothetical protein